jgi:hypothetical protein
MLTHGGMKGGSNAGPLSDSAAAALRLTEADGAAAAALGC